MAISFYEKGRLSSGFNGWHVAVTIRGKRYQKYFSLKRPSDNIPVDLWHRYQETRARYYDARWQSRAAAVRYIDFIRTDHPNTKPCRGVGFQGITLGIGPIGRDEKDHCYFQVNSNGKPVRIPISESQTLSAAWKKAVDLWGETFGIRPVDVQRKRIQPPTPDQFKQLRKRMNDEERAGLGVGVLHHVYAEQRTELERNKSRGALSEEAPETDDLLDFHSLLEREISEYRGRRQFKD